jgi:hypothetical protein
LTLIYKLGCKYFRFDGRFLGIQIVDYVWEHFTNITEWLQHPNENIVFEVLILGGIEPEIASR